MIGPRFISKMKNYFIIDQLVDDKVINALLAYDSYSPSMRETFLSHLFRAELLKSIKYPEIS